MKQHILIQISVAFITHGGIVPLLQIFQKLERKGIKASDDKAEPIIFATQRGYGEFKGGWEFPGGKIEEGETSQEALKREIKEHEAAKWLTKEKLDSVDWLPADIALIEKIRAAM